MRQLKISKQITNRESQSLDKYLQEIGKVDLLTPDEEVELAKSLIQHLAGPFKPAAFHDTYRENVERLIEQKRKGEKVSAVAKPRKAPVIDLMEALKRSLAATSAPQAAKARGSAKRSKKAKAA